MRALTKSGTRGVHILSVLQNKNVGSTCCGRAMRSFCEHFSKETELMANLTENSVREWMLQIFTYRANGVIKACFGINTPVHSVLVIEGERAYWLYGGDLSPEAKGGLVEALHCWCKPPDSGYIRTCNAVLDPEKSPFSCVIFNPSPLSSYVAGREDDMHKNAEAFRAAIEFLS